LERLPRFAEVSETAVRAAQRIESIHELDAVRLRCARLDGDGFTRELARANVIAFPAIEVGEVAESNARFESAAAVRGADAQLFFDQCDCGIEQAERLV